MTPEEIKWLELCRAHPEKYKIYVDNDCVFVDDGGEDVAFHFDGYGWQMLVDLFRYIGCNAEEV